jgi:hypothetical protein
LKVSSIYSCGDMSVNNLNRVFLEEFAAVRWPGQVNAGCKKGKAWVL